MNLFIRNLFYLIIAFLFAGCVIPTDKPTTTSTSTCVLPDIRPLAETKELQTKGGINISLAVENYKCSVFSQRERKRIAPSFAQMAGLSLQGGSSGKTHYLGQDKIENYYSGDPQTLAFRVKINNQLPRVFRGTGVVVLYNFGGRNTSISKEDYAELSNLLVPPRTEQEVTIYGPDYKDVDSGTTLGIFLYDVPIKTDEAGNILKKENFEWYYTYKEKTQQKTVANSAPTFEWIPISKWAEWISWHGQLEKIGL